MGHKKCTKWIQLPSVLLQGFECFVEVGDDVIGGLRLNHQIIDVGLDVLPDPILKTALDGSLICSTNILESKGHGGVAVGAKGCDERRIDLVFLL